MNLLQDGYVIDVPYPIFVHRQATPIWLNTIAQLQGSESPDVSKPYRYLELGCAMGIHLHLTAAANPMGHFVGVDFNPQQLMVAKEVLDSTKINNIEFVQASFEDFLNLEIEPFDFIVTHGVWSWISEKNQTIMLNIIHKLLKPNGILYCSYMSHPGATGLTSVQKLMTEMSKNLNGDSATKAVQSLSLARQIGQSKIGLFEKVPSLNQELFELSQDKPNYIAHDFLSEHWQPQHSADMIRQFGNIGLSYIAGAGIIENLDVFSLPIEIQKLIKTLPLITLQETVKDIARHTLQRQDIYVNNHKKMSHIQIEQNFKKIKFGVLPHAPTGKNLKEDSKIGMIHDAIPFFESILILLSQKQLSIYEVSKQLDTKIDLAKIAEMMLVLIWAGYIHPLRLDSVQANFSTRMNSWMSEQGLNWECLPNCGTVFDRNKSKE